MQPCKTLVLPLAKVTTLTPKLRSSSGRLPPSIPSVTGRCVTIPMVSTAGL